MRATAYALAGLVVATTACTAGPVGPDGPTGEAAPEDGAASVWPAAVSVYDLSGDPSARPAATDGATDALRRRGPCHEDPHRQFDFWLGDFELTERDGSEQGTNSIATDLDGCVVTEDYLGPDGIGGRSLNAFDRATGSWIQTFVSGTGTNFRLTGGLEGDRMVMSGGRLFPLADGSLFPVVERVTWAPLAAGAVHQTVELSVDGGATFPFTTTDLTYAPVEELERMPPVATGACSGASYDELRFWEGRWRVWIGWLPVGRSTVRVDLDGCLIEESFRSWRGRGSRTFLSYDATTEEWQRTYVDDRGHAFRLAGVAVDGTVELRGERPAPDGGTLGLVNTLREVGGVVLQDWAIEGSSARLRLRYTRQ